VFKANHQSVLWAVVGTTDPTFIANAIFVPGQALNIGSGYSNDELTAAIKASYAAEGEELVGHLNEMQLILAKEAPATFIGTPQAFNLWGPDVIDMPVNTGITLRLRDVKLAS